MQSRSPTPSDPRVPLVFATIDAAGPDDAVLVCGGDLVPSGCIVARFPVPGRLAHRSGCACCLPRGEVAQALTRLFLARARGEVGFFRRVVAVVADEAPVRAALTQDVMVAARFRLD